jgi:Xaa-Pro aminopeptidase
MLSGYIPSRQVFQNHDPSNYAYRRASDAEYARRLAKIRDFMARHGLDALLIGGGTGTWDRNWTNTRWAVNHVGCQLTNYSYVVIHPTADPTVLAFPINAWLPARRAREIVEDVRAADRPEQSAVERLRELGCESGTVGIVETDLYTSIPSKHHLHFAAELPAVRFEAVTRRWWREVRLIRSDEEIAALERAARIGDAMSEAVARRAAPGVAEREIFAALTEAMVTNGGEIPTMVFAGSGSTFTSFDTFQRERHIERMLGPGDVVVTELAPRYPDGSECQTGRSYFIGEPAPEYERLGEVMLEAYGAIVDQFRPGKTDRDVIDAARVITDAGYEWLAPLVHGAEGGASGSLPHIAASVKTLEDEPLTFAPNIVLCVEVHVGKPDHSAGLFMADTWVVTEGAPRCLNRYPREIVRL